MTSGNNAAYAATRGACTLGARGLPPLLPLGTIGCATARAAAYLTTPLL